MNKVIAVLALGAGLAGNAFAGQPGGAASGSQETHRYLVERSFPAGALEGLDRAAKDRVNANNARHGVTWVTSYANADQTRTYCIYEGPSEAAVREAAKANGIPVDAITEVPVTLTP